MNLNLNFSKSPRRRRSRPSPTSCPRDEVVGGFVSDFECIRTASGAVPERTGESSSMAVLRAVRWWGAVAGLRASRRRRWCALGRLSGGSAPRHRRPRRAAEGPGRRRGVVRRPTRHRRDACSMAWRCGLSPIDSASTAALSPPAAAERACLPEGAATHTLPPHARRRRDAAPPQRRRRGHMRAHARCDSFATVSFPRRRRPLGDGAGY